MSDEASLLDDSTDVEQLEGQDDAGQGNSEAGGEQQNDEPFLRVNDRSVYKTRDEAIKAYNEAGTRIANLSQWEKEAKSWGLDKPQSLKPIFEEYLKLKQASEAAAKAANGKSQATTSDSEGEMTPEEKKAFDWLKKFSGKLGYVPKTELEETVNALKSELETLKGQSTQYEEQRFKNQEAEAQGNLSKWLSDAKFEDKSGAKARIVGTLVKDWINGDPDLIERWRQGGVTAQNLVKEGFDLALKDLGWQPSQAAGQASNYGSDKARSVAQNKKLPAPGTATRKGDEKQTSGRRKDPMEDLHEKAFAEFERVRNGKA